MSCNADATSVRSFLPFTAKWPSSCDLPLPLSPVKWCMTRTPVSPPSIDSPTAKTMPEYAPAPSVFTAT
eukprot:scaffold112921_cov36-Phaeocystis_antarctica.AAC.3